MSRIFDNIDQDLLTTLRATMQVSDRSDFCVGYLNLRGWQAIDDLIAPWDPAAGQVCRVLVGMQRPPYEEIRELYRHLYGLTEDEFTHILGTFPLVPQPVKVAAHDAYRDVERGLIQ